MDVDGVLTDGSLYFDASGQEIKCFHVQDGAGIQFLKKSGIFVGLITGRASPALRARAKELALELYEGIQNKRIAYEDFIKKFSVQDDEVGYIGDDLPDLSVLQRVGYPFAVANACAEIKQVAHYVTQNRGGQGAVREIAERILKAQGKWESLLLQYQS